MVPSPPVDESRYQTQPMNLIIHPKEIIDDLSLSEEDGKRELRELWSRKALGTGTALRQGAWGG